MKLLGPILLLFSLSAFSAEVLVLRGRVPASYSVELDDSSENPQIKTNGSKSAHKPHIKTVKKNNVYQITITQP